MDKITVLFPGGFKPLTGAHLELANRYAQNANVERVIMLIGPKDRDGITREKTMQIFQLVNENPKITMQPTDHNSPIMAAYEYLFDLPEETQGQFAMAASTKGDDYVRAKAFVPNVDKYITIGDKSGRKMPQGIDATELNLDVDPLIDAAGNPISATTVRQALASDNYELFRTAYPNLDDAIVKNIWQILKGVQEAAMFSQDWWTKSLQEDVDEVVEAVMNTTERNRHNRKIAKLQAYLDANPGKEFVYDFDQFEPTVMGARMTEAYERRYEITREDLARLEPMIDSFFREYGIDVDFQGKYTHFLERLNDPRNESPIHIEDLVNFFEDLSAEYGDEIAQQLDNQQPTGIGSDYQFDVPMHMPFQLQWNRGTKMIQLIPRTVKKQRRAWQKNDPNDVEYRIESATPKGTLLTEGVSCEICGDVMKQITPNHLKHKHQLTVSEYKAQFPNANMISESLRASLSDNNPMNNPVNIDKIKQTKQEKYGNPNFNNIEKQQQTLMETYGVSNSAALPHNIERAKKQLDDIRTRAYESGRYLDPEKKPEYIRYRDEVRKLSERTVKQYKTQIPNIENRGRKFHLDHKYSIFEGFVNNIDAKILAHICNLEILPSTINETKNTKSSITLIELIQSIKEHDRRELLVCGGAAGHMAHPYDDHGLTFNDMKELIDRALSGRLDIEAAVTEKTDGQNIQVTWKDGQPGFARNKGTIINPLTPDQLVADFERKYQESVAKNGKEAAAGYLNVVEAYRACAEDLTEAMNKIDQERLNQIFKNGRVFANMEIIYPATQNVIAYDKAHLQFHNLVEYDEKANTVQTDLTGGKMMQQIIQDANAHMQKTFSFIPPQRVKLGRVADFEDQEAAFFNEIDQLQNQYNLKGTDLISDYHKMWWADVIRNKAQQVGYDIPENVLTPLIYRWAFFDKSTNIAMLKKQIDNPEFAAWVTEFDKKEFKQYYKQNMEPFESIFLRLGAVVLKNATNFLAANPDKAVQSIKTDMAALIKDLQTSPNPDVIAKLKMELKRIERLGGFDAIVPAEGLVFVFQGNTYKFTGAFAPVNQILGTLKYMR